MPKHESASLAPQRRQKNRAATRQASPHEGKDEVVEGETASPGRATSSRLREQQHRVGVSSTNLHMHPSRGLSMFTGEKTEAVAQALQSCKKSLFANPEGQREVEVGGLRAEEVTAPWQALHERLGRLFPNT